MLPWQTPISDTERGNIVKVVHGWSQRHMASFQSAWTAILSWSLRACGAQPLHLKSLKKFIGNMQPSFVCRWTPSYWEGLVLLLLSYSSSDEDVNTSASYKCVWVCVYAHIWKYMNHPSQISKFCRKLPRGIDFVFRTGLRLSCGKHIISKSWILDCAKWSKRAGVQIPVKCL